MLRRAWSWVSSQVQRVAGFEPAWREPPWVDFELPASTRIVVAHAERNRDLEDAIAADVTALDPYLVYADWLQDRGDPRGEWIAVHCKETVFEDADLCARRLALWHAHWPALVGPLAIPGVRRTRFRRGFLRRADIDRHVDVDELDEALAVDHPATRFLESVILPQVIAAAARRSLDRRGFRRVIIVADKVR